MPDAASVPPPPLDAARLRAALDADVLLEVHESLPSTTGRARDLLGGADRAAVVLAEQQTAGLGRRGRSWASPWRGGIALSLALRTQVPVARRALVPLLAGLAAHDAAAAVAGARVGLKWPNDVLLDDAKLAGVLVDAAAHDLVVGVGMNVTAAPDGGPGATSLVAAGVAEVDRTALAADLVGGLLRRLEAWEAAGGGSRDALPEYRRACRTLGVGVRVDLPDGRLLRARADEVDDEGRLVVVDADGATHALHAGDVVHVRPVRARRLPLRAPDG